MNFMYPCEFTYNEFKKGRDVKILAFVNFEVRNKTS